MTNVLREIRNRVNAQSRMQAQFNAAQEKALKQVEEEISSLFEGNAYHVSFSPASGSEHQISVSTGGRYTADSWQWN